MSQDILVCHTCFKELAEEYFSEKEEQYQETFEELVDAEENDQPTQTGLGWEYSEEEMQDVQLTHVHPDMNPEFLIDQPWWNKPIDVQLRNYHFDTDVLMQDIQTVVQQPLF